MQDLSGQSIKGYDLHEMIGAGGFGAVYRAYQPLVKRDVAMKVILPEYANQPDFIRSFEYEAQLVARLEHIHIVALYDYWRDPQGAYLVMRWLRGGSLRQRLRRGAIDNQAAVQIVEQVASALGAAHRRGVVHRDIKPDNILFDDEGHAFLADFGIAKDVREPVTEDQNDHGSTLTGSPFYLAPEQAQSQPISPQTDLYSLGIVTYEILTGQPPFRGDKGLMAILLQHINEPMPSVCDLRPDLTPEVDAVLQRATAKDPASRYQNATGFAGDFRRAMVQDSHVVRPKPSIQIDIDAPSTLHIDVPTTIQIDAPITDTAPVDEDMLIITKPISGATVIVVPPAEVVNPYKGLQPFEEADASDFYGRDALIERLLDRLREPVELNRFLAVIGPSGSGKSSVVKAGLIPKLRRGALRNSEQWYMIEMKPGADPFRELAGALLGIATDPPAGLQDHLRTDERALVQAISTILAQSGGQGLVLTIDQFEEVFTLMPDEHERAHFLKLLQTTVTDLDCPFRLIITLRADFYDRPLLYPEFGELVRVRNEVVLPMNNDDLRAAIVSPAERAGVAVESGLVAEIVAELGEQQGALPLLQYALTELFERRSDTMMTLAAYRETGGVLGALARRAEDLYAATDATGQDVLRQIFLRLVHVSESSDDTRRRVPQIELMSLIENSDFVIDLLDQWSKARLLTSDRDPETRMPVVTVAHESLIRQWDRLRAWLDDNREDVLLQRRLQQAHYEWIDQDRARDVLARGVMLQRYEDLVTSATLALTPDEVQFVRASVAERERLDAEERARQAREALLEKQAKDRLRLLAMVMAAAAVVALVLAGLALLSYREAEEQRAVAEDERVIADEQRVIAEIEAERANSLTLSTTALRAADRHNYEQALVCALEANAIENAPAESRQRLFDTALAPGTARVFTGHTDAVRSGVFTPDGRMILSGSWDQTLILWDAETGDIIRRFEGHTAPVHRVDISPDGSLAISASEDGTVRLWDVATGEALATFETHEGTVNSVAFSPDGLRALSASADDTVILWDVQAHELIHQYADSEAVTATDADSGDETTIYEDLGAAEAGDATGVLVIAFSPDGSSAVFGAKDGSLELWDLHTHDLIHRFETGGTEISAAAFNPSGSQLITATSDRIYLWDTATGEALAHFNPGAGVSSLSFTRDGRQFLTAGNAGDIRLWQWDVANELVIEDYVLTGHSDAVRQIALSPDGYSLLSASNDRTLRLWHLTNGGELRRFEGPASTVRQVNVSPDGSLVLAASEDGTIIIWDYATGDEVARLNATFFTFDAVFSPDGQRVATADFLATRMMLWDWQTGEVLHTWEGDEAAAAYVLSIAFTPDSQQLVSGMGDGKVRLWDVATRDLLQTFEADDLTKSVFGVAVSPDGTQLLSGGNNQVMVLWDMADGSIIRRFEGFAAAVDRVAFSPDGSQALAVSGSTLTLWDVATGERLREFRGHDQAVTRAVFNHDGSRIVSGSNDGTLRVWDAATGQIIRRLDHGGQVWTVAFGPDGQTALSGSNDATVRLWDATALTLEEIYTWIEANRYVPDAACEVEAG